MNALKLLLFFSIIAAGTAGCSNYGKEYKLDKKHNVFYKGDGVNESHAKKLAEYLKQQEYFQDSIESTVQLIKIKDTFNLNFVVDASRITSGLENVFLIIGAAVSEKVFDKAPVTVQLMNKYMEPFKNLGYAKPVSEFDK